MRQSVFVAVLRELVAADLRQWNEHPAERLSDHPPFSATCIHEHVTVAARYALASPVLRGDASDVATLRKLLDIGPVV